MSVYTIDLLYEMPPSFEPEQWLAQLQARGQAIEVIGPGRQAGTFALAYPHLAFSDHTSVWRRPLLLLALMEAPLPYETLRPALQQSWDWPQAKEIVAQHRATIRLSDFQAEQLDPRTRLALMHAAVESLLALEPCLALHWQASQHCVAPESYLAARQLASDLIFPAIHVRHFAILDPLAAETVTDTLGLAAFGLPDIQCHYRGLDQAAVATVLRQIAQVLFAHGDVLYNGDEVAGVRAGQNWRCRRSLALTPPVREVIDLDPGLPYAASKRTAG